MNITLSPRYINYWLDIARKEAEKKKTKKQNAIKQLIKIIDDIIGNKKIP